MCAIYPNINIQIMKKQEEICQNAYNDFLSLIEFQVIFVLFFIIIFHVFQNFSNEHIVCIVNT